MQRTISLFTEYPSGPIDDDRWRWWLMVSTATAAITSRIDLRPAPRVSEQWLREHEAAEAKGHE